MCQAQLLRMHLALALVQVMVRLLPIHPILTRASMQTSVFARALLSFADFGVFTKSLISRAWGQPPEHRS